MNLTKEEKKILINLICQEQARMIKENADFYMSEEYRNLEALKIKVKKNN